MGTKTIAIVFSEYQIYKAFSIRIFVRLDLHKTLFWNLLGTFFSAFINENLYIETNKMFL